MAYEVTHEEIFINSSGLSMGIHFKEVVCTTDLS